MAHNVNSKRVFENEYVVLPNSDSRSISTTDTEACVVVVCFDGEKTGLAHLRPALYEDPEKLKNAILEFTSSFNKDNLKVELVGGVLRKGAIFDGQDIVKAGIEEICSINSNKIKKTPETVCSPDKDYGKYIFNILVSTKEQTAQVEKLEPGLRIYFGNDGSMLDRQYPYSPTHDIRRDDKTDSRFRNANIALTEAQQKEQDEIDNIPTINTGNSRIAQKRKKKEQERKEKERLLKINSESNQSPTVPQATARTNQHGERLITATPQLRQRSPSLTVQKQSLSSNPNRSSSTTNIAANVSTLTQQQQALKNELIKAKDKITRNYENAKKKIRDKHQLNIFARQPKYKQAKEIQEKLLDRMYGGNQYEQYLSIPQKITDQYQEAGYTYDKRTEKWYSPQVYDKIKTQLDLQDKLSEKKDSVESTIDRLSKIKENLEDVERRIQYPGAYSDLSRIKSQVQDDIKKIDDAISQMSDYIDNLNLPLASLDRSIGKITTLQENMDNTYDNFKEVQENAIKSERQARDSKQKAIDAKQMAKEAEQASYSTRAIEEAQRNAQEAEEMAIEMEMIAREAEMKAQEAEEMAREMEIIAREAENRAKETEEWMKSIEARLSGLRAEFDTMWINDIEARLVELQLNDVPETQKEKEKVPAAPELAGWRTGEQGANIHGASAPDSKNKLEGWSNYINHDPQTHGSCKK